MSKSGRQIVRQAVLIYELGIDWRYGRRLFFEEAVLLWR